ncbi:MAG: GNAT family N-acetyltransferase [Deltaproteobacteria bacterium]|nr:GNAT family N-acetyltransferase [Deltaproteobacteria bacterium]
MDQNLTPGPEEIRVVFLAQPTDEEVSGIISLYIEAGWWEPGADSAGLVKKLVAGSHCFAAAVIDGRIVGMARAISDRASDAYIQDVTVTGAQRHRGVASMLISAVLDRLTGDGIGWIALVAERGTEVLYDRLGFFPMQGAVAMRLRS